MKIIIAEDDPITLDALATCIKREGFDVIQATNGREAIELWQSNKPDLICLDIMMPEINGYDVCRRIRKADNDLPILFLSAKCEELDIVAGLDIGADDFIRKPFTRLEVNARIRSALRRVSKTKQNSSFTFGDLVISPNQLLASRDGYIIDLTPREISIIKVLHQHIGEAVSRDTLLDTCWGIDYFPNSRTLDQHILSLRKKIELIPETPKLIRTVRSIGYRYAPKLA